ncbi:hypothetical protein BDW74DRAFT_184776 [Aspergillus multicolor]|uniref:alkene reductase n=1 Tax=Aspergillus multicolor TaxID=41759 RepID=UPI003CCDCD9B
MASSQSPLFTPLRIGNATLSHRVVMAPLTRLRADANHIPLPMAQTYYEQRASVPGTLLISEATIISPQHGGYPHAPGIWNDAQVAAWKKITDAVHAKGSFIVCQFVAVGRVADPGTLKRDGGYEVRGASAIPLNSEDGYGAVPKELTEAEIKECIDDFIRAGRNAIAAGFDGVEVHGANGYLVDQFFQDMTNQRTDGYGGSIENRARFGLEVAKGLVDAIGAERGMKMADPVPQFSYITEKLKEMGLAYLHVIESRVINNVDCEKTEGIEFMLVIWGKTSPVLVAGGYNDKNCHAAFEEYKGNDVAVVFGRHFISNPDLPFRIKEGIPLNKYDRASFYAMMQEQGYIDYPFSEEFLAKN